MTTTRQSNFGAAIRTTLLLAGLGGLLVVIGALIGGVQGATLFLVIALLINLATYFFSDKIALRAARAKWALTSAPSITSARFQPRPLRAWASSLVLPSARLASSTTTIWLACALADSACLSPSARNFLFRSWAWLRGTGPL